MTENLVQWDQSTTNLLYFPRLPPQAFANSGHGAVSASSAANENALPALQISYACVLDSLGSCDSVAMARLVRWSGASMVHLPTAPWFP